MSLSELTIGLAISGVVLLIGVTQLTLTMELLHRQDRETNRRAVLAELSNATRSPKQLKVSLGPEIDCINATPGPGAATPCAASPAFTPFKAKLAGTDLTGPAGWGCFTTNGVACPAIAAAASCSPNCPWRATTEYRIVCPGAGRAQCPSNQASLLVRYTLAPEVGVPDRLQFRPVRSLQVIQAKSLWGDPGKIAEGAAAVELSTEPTKIAKSCAPGQIMTGVEPDGSPVCETMFDPTQQCAPGEILSGYIVDGATQRLKAKCVNVTCPDVAGKKQIFVGLDQATGTKICRAINPSGVKCNPGTAISPSGVFMTGLRPGTTEPICTKKTCLPGQLYARTNPDGNAYCVDLSWFPRCGVGPCSAPPTLVPPAPGT